jgi:hypothetical protein
MTGEIVPLDDGSRLDGIRALVMDDAPGGLDVMSEILEPGGATSFMEHGAVAPER